MDLTGKQGLQSTFEQLTQAGISNLQLKGTGASETNFVEAFCSTKGTGSSRTLICDSCLNVSQGVAKAKKHLSQCLFLNPRARQNFQLMLSANQTLGSGEEEDVTQLFNKSYINATLNAIVADLFIGNACPAVWSEDPNFKLFLEQIYNLVMQVGKGPSALSGREFSELLLKNDAFMKKMLSRSLELWNKNTVKHLDFCRYHGATFILDGKTDINSASQQILSVSTGPFFTLLSILDLDSTRSKTGEYLFQFIKKYLDPVGLGGGFERFLFACLCDNASSMKALQEILHKKYSLLSLHCSQHALDLLLKALMTKLDFFIELRNEARRLYDFFNTEKTLGILQEKFRELELGFLSLHRLIETRFVIDHKVLSRILLSLVALINSFKSDKMVEYLRGLKGKEGRKKNEDAESLLKRLRDPEFKSRLAFGVDIALVFSVCSRLYESHFSRAHHVKTITSTFAERIVTVLQNPAHFAVATLVLKKQIFQWTEYYLYKYYNPTFEAAWSLAPKNRELVLKLKEDSPDEFDLIFESIEETLTTMVCPLLRNFDANTQRQTTREWSIR